MDANAAKELTAIGSDAVTAQLKGNYVGVNNGVWAVPDE